MCVCTRTVFAVFHLTYKWGYIVPFDVQNYIKKMKPKGMNMYGFLAGGYKYVQRLCSGGMVFEGLHPTDIARHHDDW